jgi:hypothetical protein
LQADALQLPLADASIAHIEANHLVEHLGHAGTIYALAEWFRVLEPGGRLHLVTPDRIAACLAAAKPTPSAPSIHWLFGLPWTGYGHRTLFDRDELRSLADQARWSEIECTPVEDAGHASSLMLTARKPLDPLACLHAGLHLAFVEAGIVEPLTAPPHLAHLESACDTIVSAVEKLAPANPRACLARVLGATARHTPDLTLAAIAVLVSQGYVPDAQATPFCTLARTLSEAAFPARMAARLRKFAALPGTQRARIARLYNETALCLTGLLHPGEVTLTEATNAFLHAAAEPEPTDLEVVFFCPETITRLSQRETARGIRALAERHLDAARCHLEVAIAYDADNFLSWWNLARLDLCQDRRLEALASYAALLELLPDAAELIRGELDAASERSDADLSAYAGPVQPHLFKNLIARDMAEKLDQ